MAVPKTVSVCFTPSATVISSHPDAVSLDSEPTKSNSSGLCLVSPPKVRPDPEAATASFVPSAISNPKSDGMYIEHTFLTPVVSDMYGTAVRI